MTTTPAARDERELFEAAYLKEYFYPAERWSLVPEKYRTEHADIAWRAWQARSALAESELAEVRADRDKGWETAGDVLEKLSDANNEIDELRDELNRVKKIIDSPELHDFAKGVTLEAAHQRNRWGNDHDAGKTPADWFWLIGYLAGKALHACTSGNAEKAAHHCISAAAALNNWHASVIGADNSMRPGTDGYGQAEIDAARGVEG